MHSPLRNLVGRRAAADQAATPAAPRFRAVRGVARGALLFALVGGTGAYAVAQLGPVADGSAAATTSPEAVAASLDWTQGEVASRSEARLAPPMSLELTVDGATRPVVTRAATVADLLDERGVVVGHDDEVSPALDAVLADGDEIVINRVVFTNVTESKEIAFSSDERRDSTLASGKREVETAGQPGSETVVYRARVENGLVTSREELIRTSVPAVNEVIRVGTYVAPAPRAASAAPSGSYSGTDPRSIARSMVAARGWSSSQFDCLDRLWQKESNWNPYAQNPSSGAYGIPQALPGSKMGTVAADWRTNPVTQITWGLNYISGRYGTPCSAWAHSQAVNWY